VKRFLAQTLAIYSRRPYKRASLSDPAVFDLSGLRRACRGYSKRLTRKTAVPWSVSGIWNMHKRTSKMPKMKTKSGAKKRFKITANGKIKAGQAGKRHGMIKRSNTFLRNARGTTVLSEPDTRIVKKFMPNG